MNKKLTLVLSIMMVPLLGFCQKTNAKEFAVNYVQEHISDLGVNTSDVHDLIVSDMYQSKHNGVTHVYLNQAYNNIPIHNAIINLNISKEDKVIHFGNRLIPNIQARINGHTPQIDALQALKKQFDKVGINPSIQPVLKNRGEHHKFVFASPEYAEGDIQVDLKYYPVGDDLVLAYEAKLLEKTNPNFWFTVIDANSGEIIQHKDETLYCSFAKGQFHKHNDDCLTIEQKTASNTLIDSFSGSYRVYALPTESPIHGAHVIVDGPHFPEASPYAWHDTDGIEGAEFTITRGNNVHAFQDPDDTGISNGDEPDGGSELVFDFLHNDASEPGESKDADITNLFYMNNMMHDISYVFGFDEPSGNFQSNNYGKGGSQGDHVLAQGQDGSNILDGAHTDNANFSSPGDGSSGRMQMYFWTQTESSTTILEPPAIAGGIDVTVPTATDWGFNYTTDFALLNINAQLVIVDDGSNSNPQRGCNPLENDAEIAGNIALIDRGVCEFGVKALNAQNAGAVAALICNVPGVNGGDGDEGVSMSGGVQGLNVTIPALFLKYSDCQIIKAAMTEGTEVIISIQEKDNGGPDYLSSSFDNGVMAHEYGHGISIRLTGGPSNSGCLPSFDDDGDGYAERGEQMGEGWSDFFSLITSVEPGDQGSDPRGVGNYLDGGDPLGRGIRRYPYSTDMNVNPQTISDAVNGSGIHNTGEVWTDIVWDLYWAFVDRYGWDESWSNKESGNFKAVQLVIDGMKFQPCAPGFGDARDAILSADQINYNGENQCLIWEVFARRGVGFYSDQGSTLTQRDNTPDFEAMPTCIQELKITKSIAGVLIPGEQTEIVISFANHTPDMITNTLLTDQIPDNSYFVSQDSGYDFEVNGNVISFDLGDLPTLSQDTIRYIIESDPDIWSNIIYTDDNENPDLVDINWSREILEGTNFWQINGFEDFTYSGYNSWYIAEVDAVTKSDLIYNTLPVEGSNPVLRFWHRYNTTQSVNGGYVEISTDGILWEDAKRKFVRNKYPTSINYGTFAIPSLEGFSGNSNEFIDSYIDIKDYLGQDISLKFKFGTDVTGNVFAPDNAWFVDDIDVIDLLEYSTEACISSDTESTCSGIKKSFVEAALGSTSVEEDLAKGGLDWDLFPNPTSDFVTLKIRSDIQFKGEVSISSLQGQRLKSVPATINNKESLIYVNTADLPSGMYFVQLQNGTQLSSKKLFID